MSKLLIKNSYPTEDTANQMNILLSTLVDFYYTYKHFHWNLKNDDFYEYHKLFDSHATTIYESQDPIAERTRQMGEVITGDLVQFNTKTLLKERLADENDLDAILVYLVECHDATIDLLEKIIDSTSEIKDFSTADLLTAYLQEHQQMRWFLVASIED
jgi:starvation-inducible DNA-binding protein